MKRESYLWSGRFGSNEKNIQMKKISSLYMLVLLTALSVLLYTACKKPIHSNAPTPNNVRLHSYTATTQINSVTPFPVSDTINDNYTFTYDLSNRVTQILYTSTDLLLPNNQRSETITFNYSNDSIVKTTMTLPLNNFYHATFETDTFLVNAQGLITNTYEPGHITNYEYYGQLLDRKSETYYHNAPIGTSSVTTTTSISEQRTYNSDNGDFLNYSFNGILTANFPNTMAVSPYAMRDYWTFPTLPGTTLYGAIAHPDLNDGYYVYTQHGGLSSYTDQLSGYSEWPITLFAVDTANDTAYCSYPGNNIYPKETYTFYTTMANRIGDYLQLTSFTQWGNNIYRNNHLVKSISNAGYTTTINYNIDAYSKITQMTVKIVDSVANTRTITYNLQYETNN